MSVFSSIVEIKLLVSQSMSTSQFCETCLKLVVSVTACEIFWSWTACSWASQETKRAKNYSPHMTTLNKAIEICRGIEAASHHMKALKSEEVNKIKDISKKKSGQHKHWCRIKKPLQSVDQKALKKCLSTPVIRCACTLPECRK